MKKLALAIAALAVAAGASVAATDTSHAANSVRKADTANSVRANSV